MASFGQFRTSIWDPILLVLQILTLQCFFYAGVGIMVVITGTLADRHISLDQLFSYEAVHMKNFQGHCIIGSFLINSIFCSVCLWFFVKRARLCLDFSCTVHFYHLIFCWIYNGSFPTSATWWLVNATCATLMCVCGEYLCIRSEMKAIPLSMGAKTDV